MLSLKILLDTIDKIKLFIDDINKLHIEFTLKAGRHTIPSRKITLLFCLNIYEPIELEIQTFTEAPEDIIKTLDPYICK